jgi:putative flippase GtrA
MRALISRLYHDQRIRFLAVGGINTLVGYVLFVAFDSLVFEHIRFGYLLSFFVSYAITIGLAFILYRRFVFKVRGRVFGDLIRFVGVYAVAIGINVVALPLLVEGVRLPPFLAQAIILVVTTLVSFFGHKKVSFYRPEEDPSEAADSQS